jgi:hypothetical protein
MTPITPIDKNSIALCSASVGFKLVTLLFGTASLGAIATVLTMLACASTLLYNGIRIIKELNLQIFISKVSITLKTHLLIWYAGVLYFSKKFKRK